MLSRLTYFSEQNPLVSVDMLKLMQSCQRNNTQVGVTGVLYYNGSSFIQVLEGGRIEVSWIFHRICKDPRHHNIVLIECASVPKRLFPNWSMGLQGGSSDRYQAVFQKYLPTARVDPAHINCETLLHVLQEIAAQNGNTPEMRLIPGR